MRKVAVVMSVYKNDKLDFLKKAIESILHQTYSEFDFFIQSDGVLKKECREYIVAINDDRIHFRERNENIGMTKSFNELLREEVIPGKYKYAARMDADDISLPERFEKQIKYLESNPKVGVLGTCAELIDEQDIKIGHKRMKTQVSFNDMVKNCELIHPAVMMRTSVFEKHGLYDETLFQSQDYELWLRILKAGIEIQNLEEPLFRFRYDTRIINRRKEEQNENIRIKKQYLKGVAFYKAILKNVAIKYMPNFVIKFLLKRKIK